MPKIKRKAAVIDPIAELTEQTLGKAQGSGGSKGKQSVADAIWKGFAKRGLAGSRDAAALLLDKYVELQVDLSKQRQAKIEDAPSGTLVVPASPHCFCKWEDLYGPRARWAKGAKRP